MDHSTANQSPKKLIAPSVGGNSAITRELARLLLSAHAEYLSAFADCRRKQSASHVHGLRIATRRLRVMIALCGSAGPSEIARRIRRLLRRPFRTAGRLRDRHVACVMMKEDAHRHIGTRVWSRWLAPRDDRDRQRLRDALRRRRATKLTALVAELGGRLQSAAGRTSCNRRVVAGAADVLLLMRQEFLEASRENIDRVRLHKLRIRLKRLRYALELLEPLLDPVLRDETDRMRILQHDLGEITDRGMLIQRICACASRRPDRRRGLLELEFLLRREREEWVGIVQAKLRRLHVGNGGLSPGIA